MSEPFLGEVKLFAGNFAPRGWAFCEGQLMSIAQNQALFSLLGTTYGGDGRTTFGLPDLRGRAPVGIGVGPGLTDVRWGERQGLEFVSLHQSNLPSISQSVSINVGIPVTTSSDNSTDTPSSATRLGPASAGGRPAELYSTDAASTTLEPFVAEGNTTPIGNNTPVENRSPSLGMYYIIAIEGLFPSRS